MNLSLNQQQFIFFCTQTGLMLGLVYYFIKSFLGQYFNGYNITTNKKNIVTGLFFGMLIGLLTVPFFWPYLPWFYQIVLILSLTLIFLHESFTLCIFILLLFFRPWEIIAVTDELISIPRFWFLLTLIQFTFAISKLNFQKLNKLDLTVFLFVIFMGLTLVFKGQAKDYILYYDTLFRSGVLYFLIRWSLNNKFSLFCFEATLVCVGLFLISTIYVDYLYSLTASTEVYRSEAFGLFKNSNDIAALLVLTFPFVFKTRINTKVHIVFNFLFLSVVFFAIYLSQSRGGFLGAVVAMIFLVASQLNFKIFTIKRVLSFLLLSVVFFKLYTVLLGREVSDIEISTSGRINYWLTSIRMFIHNPILGIGFGQYPVNFEKYTFEFFEYGERTAHSSFFLVLAEGGLIGILLFILMFYFSIQKVNQVQSNHPYIPASFFGYLTCILFLSHSYLFFIFILFAFINSMSFLRSGELHESENTSGTVKI